MRTEVYNYISGLSGATLGTYRVSSELPWDNNGTPLYLSNPKSIYVDVDQITQQPNFNSLSSAGAVDETTTVRVYFVNDAKQLPSNYETLVTAIKQARLLANDGGYIDRLCQVSTDFNSDRVITTFEFSYKKLLTN